MIRVDITFRQRRSGKTLARKIELPQVPSLGMYFVYEDGWSPSHVGEVGNFTDRHNLYSGVSVDGSGWIDGYGPQFRDEEIEKLVALGWRLL